MSIPISNAQPPRAQTLAQPCPALHLFLISEAYQRVFKLSCQLATGLTRHGLELACSLSFSSNESLCSSTNSTFCHFPIDRSNLLLCAFSPFKSSPDSLVSQSCLQLMRRQATPTWAPSLSRALTAGGGALISRVSPTTPPLRKALSIVVSLYAPKVCNDSPMAVPHPSLLCILPPILRARQCSIFTSLELRPLAFAGPL